MSRQPVAPPGRRHRPGLLLVGILLLLAASGLVLILLPWAATDPAALPECACLPSSRSSVSAADPATPASPAARQASSRQELLEVPPEPAVEGGMEVVVVDRDTGLPVPGATVWFLDPFAAPDPGTVNWAFFQWEADPFRVLSHLGRKFAADAAGKTRIPPLSKLPGRKWVYGYLGGSSGDRKDVVLVQPHDNPPFELLLAPVPVVRVQVLDAFGRPRPGVALGLLVGRTEAMTYSHTRFSRKPDGIAAFPRFRWQMDSDLFDPAVRFGACLAIPLDESVELDPLEESQAPACLPGGLLRLVLPDTGRVEVRALGTLREAGIRIGLKAIDGNQRARLQMATQAGQPLKEGRTLFAYVGLGLKLQAFAFRPDEPYARDKSLPVCTGPGPTRIGETVLLELIFRD